MTTRKTIGSLFLLVAVVGGLLVGASGGAAGATVELSNSTVAINNDTDTAYASINNTATTDTNVTVTYVGIQPDGTEVQVAQNDVTATAGTETLNEQSVDPATYDEARISVSFNDTNANASELSADYGTFQQVSGGGGSGGFGSMGSTTTYVLVAIVALLGLMMVKD